MSASVKAALAAKRAEARASSRSNSPVKASSSGSRLPTAFSSEESITTSAANQQESERGRLRPAAGSEGAVREEGSEDHIAQVPIDDLLNKCCDKGKLNVSARVPELKKLPGELYSLIHGDEPAWHDRSKSGRGWYEREDLSVLQAGSNAISAVEEELGECRALVRIEVSPSQSNREVLLVEVPISASCLQLQQNLISNVPLSFTNLLNLTHLNLSANSLTEFPEALLCLNKLRFLDLSSNRIAKLWRSSNVMASRSEQKRRKIEWEKENGAVDVDGMWAGYLSGPSSPIKKGSNKSLLPKRILAPTLPLHSLETLNLSKNRLTNAVFALEGAGDEDEFGLPPRLKRLDLSGNDIRGPLEVSIFADLPELQELNLSGTGVSDQVFSQSSEKADGEAFTSLALLHLAKCDLDSLAPLEQFFGGARIRDQGSLASAEEEGAAHAASPASAQGVARKQLIKVKGSPSLATGPAELHVVLEGCRPFRDEELRRKRGPGHPSNHKIAEPVSSTHTSSGSSTAGSEGVMGKSGARSASKDTLRGEPRHSSGFEPTRGDHGSPGVNTPKIGSSANGRLLSSPETSPWPQISPTQVHQLQAGGDQSSALAAQMSQLGLRNQETTGGQKEEWELMAEAGLLTEGGKRRMRAEQARREREMQQREQSVLSSSPAAGRGGGGMAARNQAGHAEDFLDGAEADAGSALANARLSSKKKEALSQVPCKFFRSNGCSAGAACPFAHTYPGEGLQKSTCQWFLKGNCRFGHKCALAHILPGQPISVSSLSCAQSK